MNVNEIKNFVLEYTKSVDLIDCVNYSISNNFVEPEDFSNYGCKIDFITLEKSSVKDENALKEWYVHNNNKYVQKKLAIGDSLEFSFPPMFNFITEEDLTINVIDENSAEVTIGVDSGSYLIKVAKGGDNEFGLIITAIYFKLRWGGDYSPIIE